MKFKNITTLIAIILLFIACDQKDKKTIDVPKNLIPEEKMAEILSEVQLIEAYLNQIPYEQRGNNDTDYVYYPLLFEKFQVNKQDFLDNLAYYAQYEKAIMSIYDNSIIILNKLKAKDLEIRLQMKMDSIRQDSIKQAEILIKADSLKKTKALNKK